MADIPSTPLPEDGLQPDVVVSAQSDGAVSAQADVAAGGEPEVAAGGELDPNLGGQVLVAPPPSDPTGRTRISGVWVGVIIAAVVLALLLVFILQNTKSVKISYFSSVVTMPIGVALLLATIGGVLFAGVVASLRIWQLRHRLNGPGALPRAHRVRRPATAIKRRAHPGEA
jgi:uncharacterized integral membrane protein